LPTRSYGENNYTNTQQRRLTIEVLDQLKATGNPECMVCGFGETCPMSGLPWIFGEDIKVTPEKFCKVEDQTETWEQAKVLG
jgi:hypothetical protein